MEFDSQLLQDLLKFLQTLGDVTLPAKFETIRGTLLGRVTSALAGGTEYMQMQPGKPTIQDNSVADNPSEEYVIPDHRPVKTAQSFLHQNRQKKPEIAPMKLDISKFPRPPTHLPVVPDPSSSSISPTPTIPNPSNPNDIKLADAEEIENVLPEMYNSMTLMQAQSKPHYHGLLLRKERWFLFENLRSYSAVLIDSYLLSYDNKTDPRPSQVLCIKGCTCKPIDKTRRNMKKLDDSTFEIYDKDNESYQFIAQTPKDMMQWLTIITQWEVKSGEIKSKLNSPPPRVPPPNRIPEAETTSDESSSNEEEYDVVIHDIAGALAGHVQPCKPNPSPRPIRQPEKPKPVTPKSTDPYKTPNSLSPHQSKIKDRTLPPPPSLEENSKTEDDVYDMIDDHNPNLNSKIGCPESSNSNENMQGINADELYDDIEAVKRDVQQLEVSMNSKKEIERSVTPSQSIAEDDEQTYDDVGCVKKGVEQLKMNENTPKTPSHEIEKEKKSPMKESPKVSGKSLQVKGFLHRLRHRNESPVKQGGKKKPMIPTPEDAAKKETPTRVINDHRTPETRDNNSCSNIVEDISNYNSPPSPRPISPNDFGYDGEEPIYDDVVNKPKDVVDNHNDNVSPKKDSGNAVKADESQGRKFKLGPVPNHKLHRNVVRNLKEEFETEIYENQHDNGENVEDDSEFYQVPRADANLKPVKLMEDDNGEEIYDDVDIVAQKKRENEQAKEKPVVKTPPKINARPAVMAKPAANKSFDKLNKFISSVAEKTTSENNIQHRFSPTKKPKGKPIIIPLKKKNEIINNSNDEELYDDLHSK